MTWNNLNIQFVSGPTDATLNFDLSTRNTFYRRAFKLVGRFQQRFGLFLKNPEVCNGGDFKFERGMVMESKASAAKCTVSGSIGRLERNRYKKVNMPTNADRLWCHVPLPKSDA